MRDIFLLAPDQDYLDLWQGTESVMEITKMFTERALFCHEFVASEQAQMTQYLSMLKKEIHHLLSTQRYGTLVELHEAAKRWEIELEFQARHSEAGSGADVACGEAIQGH